MFLFNVICLAVLCIHSSIARQISVNNAAKDYHELFVDFPSFIGEKLKRASPDSKPVRYLTGIPDT